MSILDTLNDVDELWRKLGAGSSLHHLRQKMSAWLVGVVLWMSTPLVALSLSRYFITGWVPAYSLHVGLYIVFWCVFLVRHKVSLMVTAGTLVMTFLVVGLAGYMNMGLFNLAPVWLTVGSLIATMLLGARAGIMAIVFSVAVSTAFAYFHITLGHTTNFVNNTYQLSASVWALAIAVWALPSILIISLFIRFGRSVLGLLREASDQAEKLRISELRFRSVIDSALNVGVVTTDDNGHIQMFNHGAEKIFGHKSEDVKGQELTILMPQRFQDAHVSAMHKAFTSGRMLKANTMQQVVGVRADGQEFPMEISRSDWVEGGVRHFSAIMLDITERIAAQKDIAMLHLAIEQSPFGMAILHQDGTLAYSNAPYQRMRHLEPAQLKEHNALAYIDVQTDTTLMDELNEVASVQGRWSKDLMIRAEHGHHRWERVTISPVRIGDEHTSNYLLMVEDMTQVKNHQEELNRLSNQCPLTHLPNRLLLNTLVTQGLEEHARYMVMVVDIIGLKHINESLGFEAGDALIIDAAKRMGVVRPTALTLAHLGAGQFVLAGGEWTTDDINNLATNLVQAFQEPFELHNERVFQGVSIGIAVSPNDGQTADALLSNAHTAKGQARILGENRWAYFSTQLNDQAQDRLHLDSLLRQALKRQEFELHFQPKVNRQSQTCGVEALLRWNSTELGMVSPARFIAFAEHNDLILLIGQWVLDEGCRFAARLLAEGHDNISVAINVSVRQFLQENFIEVVKKALHDANIPPQVIELEITEGVFLAADDDTLNEHVNTLRAMGLRLALDDFGTGYASLGYLRRIAFDTIKIDQTFIRDLFTRSENTSLVKSMIDMGHALGAQIVAEGVEDERQMAYLVANQCDLLQGYYYARPMTADALLQSLQARSGKA